MSLIKLPAILLASVAIALFSGCGSDSSNNADTSTPTVPTVTSAVTLGVQAVDSVTGRPVPGASLTITDGADNFTPGTAITDATTGTAVFTANDNVSPSAENPVSVSVSASASGFTTSGQTATITSAGATDLEIPLTSITGTQPAGVSVGQVSATSTNGTPSAPITATVESDGESASIEIGTDVQMTDASGNPVSGEVTVTAGYYDANSEEALEAFPGGFSVSVDNASEAQAAADTNVTGEVGADNQLTFVSAGFTSVEITDENGNKVKNFSKPVPVTMTISETTQNPDTGANVKVGDQLPIWSYDADTGKWTYQGQGTVEENGNTTDGLLQVVHNTNHLSYFNLDWYRSGTRRCDGNISVLDNTGNAVTKRLRVRVANTTSGNSKSSIYKGDGILALKNLLVGIQTTATFTDITTGTVLGSIGGDLTDLCGDNSINLNLDELPSAVTSLTIKTVTYCSNNAAEPDQPVPSTYTALFQDSPRWFAVDSERTNSEGEYVVNNLVVPLAGATTPTYTLYIYDRINRRWHIDPDTNALPQNLVFNEGTHTYTARFPQVCPVTTGAG